MIGKPEAPSLSAPDQVDETIRSIRQLQAEHRVKASPEVRAMRKTKRQPMPGLTAKMQPIPDHGESSYQGHGRLLGKKAIITGGDSGIGRAVSKAFACEGADLLIAYLDEHDDAQVTKRLVEEAGRTAVLLPGDIRNASHYRAIVDKAVSEFGQIDILANNAAHQATFAELEQIEDAEWEHTLHAMFYLTKAAVPHEIRKFYNQNHFH
jgi:short chain dehydrogenase